MEVNFLAKYANPTLVGMLYERVGDKLFLIIYPFSIYFIITEKYLNILFFDTLIFFTLVLLRHKLVFLDFYFKRIVIIFWVLTLTFSTISFMLFNQINYLYMTKAYVECSVLDIKEYSLVYRYKGYATFMMKSHESIKDDFTVIENLVGKIDSYEIGEENKYRVILKNNQEVDIKFNNYNQFTLFSLDVD